MIRKEPAHARRAREGTPKSSDGRRRKRRVKAKAARKPKKPPPKTWEELRIARLEQELRIRQDQHINKFLNDVTAAQLSNRAVLVASEINDRGQQCTMAIPFVHLRDIVDALRARLSPVAAGTNEEKRS